MTKLLSPVQEWIFIRDGVPEKIALERWAWKVIYRDGNELRQFDHDGRFHQIREIDQTKVAIWTLYKTEDENRRVEIIIPEGATLIHKYRNLVFNAMTPQETRERIYVFGYEFNGHTHYNYILPNDRILQSIHDEIKLSEAL